MPSPILYHPGLTAAAPPSPLGTPLFEVEFKYLPVELGVSLALLGILILGFFSGRKTSLGCAGPTPGIRTETDAWD